MKKKKNNNVKKSQYTRALVPLFRRPALGWKTKYSAKIILSFLKANTEILKELKVGQDWLLNNIKAMKLSYFGHLKRHDSLEKHIIGGKA